MVEQCNLASRFPNVFVQGLNFAKNRPTSLIWTEYILGQVWYLIVSIPDLCNLICFNLFMHKGQRQVNFCGEYNTVFAFCCTN